MLAKLNLGSKFNIILVVVSVVGIGVSAVALQQALKQLAAAEVDATGQLLLQTMDSVRTYTSTEVRPHLADELETSPEFVSQSVPAFSAREVFEILRSHKSYGTFLYKEATLNPTNPRDAADDFETVLVERFRNDSSLTEVSGFRTLLGENLFYSARPLAVSDESCLDCHGDPADAPTSLVSSYDDTSGFGWELGEIVAAQIIYVPGGKVAETAQSFLTNVLGIVIVTLAIVIVSINVLLRRAVIQPVGQIAALAQAVADDRLSEEVLSSVHLERVAGRTDELGQLAVVFQRMAREVWEREQTLKQQIASLQIKIDANRQAQQVSEIVETEFFSDLQDRAGDLRSKRQKDKPDEEE